MDAVSGRVGAVVCTFSVALPLPPVMVAGEKVQVVSAGNWPQVKTTGRVKSAPDVTATVYDAASPV